MFRLLQNEICYTALPLPEILKLVGEKVNAPFGKALLLTAEHMRLENGEEFQTVWEEKMKEMLKETSLTAQQKTSFPKPAVPERSSIFFRAPGIQWKWQPTALPIENMSKNL